MTARRAYGVLAMIGMLMGLLTFQAHADGTGAIQRYFSDVANKVKAAVDPSEKRAILDESFQTMSKALEIAQSSPLIAKDDLIGIDRFKAALQEKQDELAGSNGFVRVSDEQLDAFSDYVVQDSEQAAEFITISLVTLLLIIILVVLIVK